MGMYPQQPYLMVAAQAGTDHGLLGGDDLLPLLQLLLHALHVFRPFLQLPLQLVPLQARSLESVLGRLQAEGEAFLGVQQVLQGELGQPEELQQHGVHGTLAVGAALVLHVAEGNVGDLLLQNVEVQLAGHPLDVDRADTPPVHALPPRPELKHGHGGGPQHRRHPTLLPRGGLTLGGV